jgi:competence protein ComEA
MKEPHAVLLLLGLAVAGHGVRLLVSRASDPPGQILAAPVQGDALAAHRDRAIRLAKPLAANETIDLNTASAEEIDRLPRIGMSLAKRIVADRDGKGPFASLSELERVAGVGPALIDQLHGKVRFGGVIRPIPPPRPLERSQSGSSSYEPARKPVGLNSATETELRALPGIGPVRARAILAYRREKGPFAAVSELRAVAGFTKSLVRKLAPMVSLK